MTRNIGTIHRYKNNPKKAHVLQPWDELGLVSENIFRRGIYELASGSKTSEGFPEWRPAKTLIA